MQNIKFIAVDIDGVILEDTFSPVLRQLILKYGGIYSQDIERNVFSKNQKKAASYIIDKLNLNISAPELIAEYFVERDLYLATHAGGLMSGALDMLAILASFNLPMICYGGLERSQLHSDFSLCDCFFQDYICTNDFRPGVAEIITQASVRPNQILFIDDVNTVAETCKILGGAFIGVPPQHSWGWQKKDMESSGVTYYVSCLEEITNELLIEVDNDTSNCFRAAIAC